MDFRICPVFVTSGFPYSVVQPPPKGGGAVVASEMDDRVGPERWGGLPVRSHDGPSTAAHDPTLNVAEDYCPVLRRLSPEAARTPVLNG